MVYRIKNNNDASLFKLLVTCTVYKHKTHKEGMYVCSSILEFRKMKILENMFCHPVGQKDTFLVLTHAGM